MASARPEGRAPPTPKPRRVSLTPYQSLEQEFRRHFTLRGAAGVLRWDAAVMMPAGSAEARAEQLALLDAEAHAVLAAPRISTLLDRAEANAGALEPWQLANLQEMRRRWLRATALPRRLVATLAQVSTVAESAWQHARAQSDFRLLRPHLEKLVPLVAEKGRRLGERIGCEPYAALVDQYDPGRSLEEVDTLFSALTERLPSLVDAIVEAQAGRPAPPALPEVPVEAQRRLARRLMERLGFPFDRGRLDESAHPMTQGTPGDVRVTTRYDPADLPSGLMAVLHETGHALYEFGLPAQWRNQPVGRDRGMTVHESQSLFLERVVGRGRAFATFLGALLAEELGTHPAWEPEALHRRLTRVGRKLIRVEADEATYSLHVTLRHELEQALVAGELAVKDLPEAWNEALRSRLGVVPHNDREGCLQDVHWAAGAFGYFCTYALGALTACQLHQALLLEHPDLPERIARGDFGPLLGWLGENVHALGARYGVAELIERATGRPLSATAFLDYLQRRYLEAG